MMTDKLNDAELSRFQSKYLVPTDNSLCWQWLGKLDNGYGRFWLQGKLKLAHRIAWEQVNGPVPDKKHLDHLCRNRGCVNPDHLEPVTIGENVLRGEGYSAINARKTHCKNGHELSGDNLYNIKRGGRTCGICQLGRLRKWREKVGA